MADRRLTAALAVLAALAIGCEPETDMSSGSTASAAGSAGSITAALVVAPEGFDRAVASLRSSRTDGEGIELDVWFAGEQGQRQRGLTGVTDLDADGMLFVFDAAGDHRFYMWQTPLPLDIYFFDADGRFVGVQTMTPCSAESSDACARYSPDVPFLTALETPAGSLDALPIDESWTLSFGPAPREAPVPASSSG